MEIFPFPQVLVVALMIRPTSWEDGPGLGGSSQTPKGDDILQTVLCSLKMAFQWLL